MRQPAEGTAAKKVGRPPGGPRVSLNLWIDPELRQQVKINALIRGLTCSDVVSELVRKHLEVYTVNGDRDGRPGA